jgi:heptosyltransferase-2
MSVKVLIIRFSSIGDIVLTTPVIRCIKQQLNNGDVEVHYLTKQQFVPLLEHNQYIDKLISIDSKVVEVEEQLGQEGYDYVFDLHKNLRSNQAKKAARALSFSFEKFNIEKWLLVNFKWNRMPDVHIVDRYMATTKAFGIENDQKGLDFNIPENSKVDLKTLPVTHQHGYVAYAIGGQHDGKIMPTDRIIELCKKLNEPIVLLGGAEDARRGKQIEQAVGGNIFNACGQYSVLESASLLDTAKTVISHDTGLMHIASALKKKVISLWGATTPNLGMYPYLPGKGSKIIEPIGVWDRPYSKLGDRKWYKPPFKGMYKIDLDEVVKAVQA